MKLPEASFAYSPRVEFASNVRPATNSVTRGAVDAIHQPDPSLVTRSELVGTVRRVGPDKLVCRGGER